MVDKLANMSLTMLRTSRRKVATPQLNDSDGALKDGGAPPELTAQAEALTRPRLDFTGQEAGLKRVSSSEAMTASDRLRANLLLETSPSALTSRSPRPKLSDDLPIFLRQPVSPPLGSRSEKLMASFP